MLYDSRQMEEQALLDAAGRICAAARTAPKAKGIDNILTLTLTGEDKEALAEKMDEIAVRDGLAFFSRDAGNLRGAGAVILIGAKAAYGNLPNCNMCGFGSCKKNSELGGRCYLNGIDLGIALGSAAAAAADARVDSRIMYSAGRAAMELPYSDDPSVIWHALPISISGKSIFFDRKPK